MPRHRFASLALVVMAALPLTGCTAIGFGVGAMVDRSEGKGPATRLARVHTGSRVTLWLSDGRRIARRLLGSRDSLSESPLSAPSIRREVPTVPLRAVLLMGTNRGVERVPIREVTRVSVSVAGGKVAGTISGLAVDACMLFVFVQALAAMN
jgi:hypothetical protein